MSDPSTLRPRQPRRLKAPTTPDPIEIAMEALASGAAPVGVAHRLLENQNRLVGWQIAVERMGFLLKLMTALAGLALVAGLAAFAWDASKEDGLVVGAFSVPPELEARGLTGKVVASMLLDELTGMQALANSNRTANSYRANTADDLKVEIPQTGVSVAEVRRLLVQWLGAQTVIEGEVYRSADGLVVQVRTAGQPAEPSAGAEADLARAQGATA